MAKRLDARVILVEGLPGAGKTTLAAGLAHALERRGVAARWLREEDPAHPVTPRALKRTRGEDGFALRCVDAIAPLRPRLVHLGSSAPRGFLRDRGGRARGPTWVERVAAYVAETPLARARGWQGRDGMLAFWSHYDALCAEALAALSLPILRLPIGDDHWPSGVHRVLDWLLDDGAPA